MTRRLPNHEDVDASAPALVLRSGSSGFPQHGTLGVVRSLGRLGVRTTLASPNSGGITGLSRYAAGWDRWEPRDLDDDRAFEALRLIGERRDRPVLFPTDDLSALFVAAHANELRHVFRMPSNPAGVPSSLVDKLSLASRCRRLGIGAPRTAAVEDAQQAARFLDEASLPVVVKQDLASIVGGAGRGVTVARTRDDVVAAVRKTAGGRVLLQEHIPGHPGRVNWLFNGYLDAGSVCRFGATGRKTGQYPAYSGMATAAVVQRNDEVERLALTLLQDAGYAGPVDVDVRFDGRDRRYKVLDVNPRVGGTFRLFVAPNGMDVVRAAYLDLTHQLVPISMVPDGRSWLVETHVAASGLAYRKDGWISVGAWLRSVAGVDEGAFFSLDDIRPMLGAAGQTAVRVTARLGGRSRR